MPKEHRYTDTEVAQILEHASAAQVALHREPQSGLTLAQVQEIAGEVGIAPEVVARAAAGIRAGTFAPAEVQSFAGLPIGVARTVELEREVSDEEWEQLVATLRMTFNAHGKVRTDGRTRRWSNGNLQAIVEPGEHGHRLRLSTVKGNAKSLLGFGATVLTGSAALLAASITGGAEPLPVLAPVLGVLLGTGTIAGTIASVRDWSRRRAEQMKQIAERVSAS